MRWAVKKRFTWARHGVPVLSRTVVLFLLTFNFQLSTGLCQQPTSTSALFEVNSHYVGGRTWADYKASAGAGLTLNVAAGTAICGNPPVKVDYAGGTLTMTNAATNYVYLNPAASCAPAKNTTGFTAGVIPLAQVVAAGGTITGVTDVRTFFVDPNSLGSACRADLMPGANAGAQIAACYVALPVTGGSIDALQLPGAQVISSDPFVGGTKPVHLLLGDTTFTVTNNTVITLPSGSTVSAIPGHTVFSKNGTGQIFSSTGAVTATATNLTAIVASGAQTLTVAASAGFAVDDWVMINDNTSDAGGGTHSELAQVRTVPGGGVSLTLKAGTVNAYTTTKSAAFTASVVKMAVVKDVEVSGVTIDRTGSPADLTGGGGMVCTYAVNCRFAENTIRNFDTNAIVFSYSYRGIAQDNWVGNSFSNLDTGGEGWAIQVAQSHFVDISHNFFTQIKELAWSGDSSHVDFSHNIVHGMRYGPNIHFNHGNSCSFIDNKFVGETTNAATTDPQVYGGIIELGDPSGQSIISENSAKNFFGPFIKVLNATDQSRTIITNNLGQGMRDCQSGYGYQIYVQGFGITISNNQVYDPPAGCRGIGVRSATRFVFNNNLVVQTAPVASADVGVEIKDSKYGTVVGNVIEGFSEAGNIGLWIRSTNPGDTDQVSMGSNTLRNNTTPITVDSGAVNVGIHIVTFSATPAFDASLGDTQKITLTGNVTGSTLSNATTGEIINFVICQDGSGSHTFVWPTNVKGGMTIGSTLSKCNAQDFIFDGTNAYALSAGVINM